MRSVSHRLFGLSAGALAPALLCLALAGCGSSGGSPTTASAAAATPTPTCPPASAAAASVKFVSGTIASATPGTITVTPKSGAPVTVQVTSTTRITKLAPATQSAIQVGDVAQVSADATGTIAQRIVVQSAGAGFGGGTGQNGGQPRVTRTPGSRFNPACFGQGRQRGTGAALAGQGGRISAVSNSQVELIDTQGQTLTYGITSSTVILAPTAGTTADLVAGDTVTATGTATGNSITARSITVTSAGQ